MKILRGLTALMMVGLLQACGGGDSADPASGSAPSAEKRAAKPAAVSSVAVTPSSVTLVAGASQDFVCTVTGSTTNKTCTWSVLEAGGGSVTTAGRYTAPATTGTYHLKATAAADATKSAQATITVFAPQTGTTPWVTGYYAGWYWPNNPGYAPATVDMSAMTHFVFGRIAPGGGIIGGTPGTVVQGAGTAHLANQDPAAGGLSVEDYLVQRAHAAGIKALVMLGGAGDYAGFQSSTNSTNRATFVRNVVDYLVAHGYDGVDVDWEEYIDPTQGYTTNHAQLLAFLSAVRAEANSRPRFQAPNQPVIVTFPGGAISTNSAEKTATAPWRKQIADLVDQYNLMTYGIGMAGDWDGWWTWHMGALRNRPGIGADGWPKAAHHPFDIESSINAHIGGGIPASKLGIGIGFYGINYGYNTGPDQAIIGTNDTANARYRYQADDNEWAYYNLFHRGYLSNGVAQWDADAQQTYRVYAGGYRPGSYSTASYLSYEDERSIAAKGQWVRERGLGGTIVWTINYGSIDRATGNNPLLSAVKQSFITAAQPAALTSR